MHRWREASLVRRGWLVAGSLVAVGLLAPGLLVAVGCSGPEAHTRVRLDDSSSLHGTDVDHDGVRDDVARAIEAMSVAAEAKSMLKDFAKSTEEALDLTTDKAAARQHALDEDHMIDCGHPGVDSLDYSDEIDAVQAFVVNTAERDEAYRKYDVLLGGGSYPVPDCELG